MFTRNSRAGNAIARSVSGLLRLRTLTALLVATGVLATAGCSGHSSTTDEQHEQVASIATKSSPAASSSAAGEDGWEIRPDSTQADISAAYVTYYACLKTHGVAMVKKDATGQGIPASAVEKPAAAYQACKSRKPYLSPLLDKTKNPNWADQTRTWMACMTGKGVPVSGDPFADFFTFGQRRADIDGARYVEIYRECQMVAYK